MSPNSGFLRRRDWTAGAAGVCLGLALFAVHLEQRFLTRAGFPPGDIWHHMEAFLVVTPGGGVGVLLAPSGRGQGAGGQAAGEGWPTLYSDLRRVSCAGSEPSVDTVEIHFLFSPCLFGTCLKTCLFSY